MGGSHKSIIPQPFSTLRAGAAVNSAVQPLARTVRDDLISRGTGRVCGRGHASGLRSRGLSRYVSETSESFGATSQGLQARSGLTRQIGGMRPEAHQGELQMAALHVSPGEHC
jgi:hypothetical protein